MCWIVINNYGIKYIFYLLDDFIIFERLEEDGEINMKFLFYIFILFNIFMALNKIEGFITCLEYLGIILDFEVMEVRLLGDKLFRIKEFLIFFYLWKSCIKREFL